MSELGVPTAESLLKLSSTLDQEARAVELVGTVVTLPLEAARLIVSLQDQLAKPAHEREPPHCPSCGCGLAMTAGSLDDQALLTIAHQWDQGSGATFEFDTPTLLRFMRSFAATVEGMLRDGAISAPLTDAEIDAIANEGHRNANGGIYATSVYEFARAIESAHRAPSPPGDG